MNMMEEIHVTYGSIIERERNDGLKASIVWLNSFQDNDKTLPETTIRSSIIKIIKEYKSMLKSKNRPGFQEKILNFEKQIYIFPNKQSNPRKRKYDSAFENSSNETLKEVNLKIAKELNNSIEMNKKIKAENEEMKNCVEKKCTLKYKLKISRSEVRTLKSKIGHLEFCVNAKNKILKRLRAQNNFLQSKVNAQSKKHDELLTLNHSLKQETSNLNEELVNLRGKFRDEREENEYLRLLIEDNNIKLIKLFDEDKKVYTKETQECVFELLNKNVTTSNVSPVITTVLKLIGFKANRLPSTSTVNNMNIQRLILSQCHIAEELAPKNNTCLLSDETSKFGKQFEGFHIADGEGHLWVLGLRHLTTKSGSDCLKTFQQILSDIDDTSVNSENVVSKEILINISSTMSDRAATQIKFNQLLEEFRTQILTEKLGAAWGEMTDSEQSSISKLNNFFCGLHVLVHAAETASACLVEAEKVLFDSEVPIHDPSFRKQKESGCLRLIRTVSKAFSCGGDEKSGVFGPFNLYCKPFLQEKGLNSLPLERFRGNRFNILFSNAAAVYFLLPKITEFLQGNDSNRLLKSIKFDISKPEFVAGCKALGLIAYFITIPLWCSIEDKEIHILDFCIYYQELLEYLETNSDDTDNFMLGENTLSFHRDFIKNGREDSILQSLLEPSPHDNIVNAILKVILPGLCKTVKHLLSDYLDNGPWKRARESNDLRNKTQSVPKHNKFAETIFGHLDRVLREKPNISLIAVESCVMFVHNNTLEWLQTKSEVEKTMLMAKARKDVTHVRQKFKDRLKEIERQRRLNIDEKLKKAEESEKKRLSKLQEYTNDILEWGLWQSEAQVDFHMSLKTTCKTNADKMKAVKSQLNFRRYVLLQIPKEDEYKDVYLFSKKVDNSSKRKNLSADELAKNIKKLIRHGFSLPEKQHEGEEDAPMLVGKCIKMYFEGETGTVKETWTGHVISTVMLIEQDDN